MSDPYYSNDTPYTNGAYSQQTSSYRSIGTPSTASTASPKDLSQLSSFPGPAYPGIAYSDFSVDASSESYGPPQPSIPFTFEAPTRSRRQRRPKQPQSPEKDGQLEDFDFPQPRAYQTIPPGLSSLSPNMSKTEKDQIVNALKNNQIKTLVELRRVEKSFVNSGDRELREAVAASWGHYVNSNNLLNELRTLTRSYPFGSECLDEAKWKVIEDPNSARSWNYCWLVLVKVQNDGLITKHANWMASKPEMWGNTRPNPAAVAQLATNFSAEWTRAVTQLLRHWESPPTVTGA